MSEEENNLGVESKVISMTLLHREGNIYFQLLNASLWSTYCVPGTVLGAQNMAMNKREKIPCPCRILYFDKKTDSKEMQMSRTCSVLNGGKCYEKKIKQEGGWEHQGVAILDRMDRERLTKNMTFKQRC